jgi:hypothetical protein
MAAASPFNPQSWNRYAYVINSPLSYVDPLGLDCGNGTTSDFAPDSGATFKVIAIGSCPSDPLAGFGLTTSLGSSNWAILRGTDLDVKSPRNPLVPANNGFTLGIRAPGQTWSQCMAANANTYSIGGATELTVNVATGTSSNISQTTSIVTGNGITGLIFEGPGAGDFLSAAGSGAGSALTYGRRTSSIMSLNLAGSGGLPQALGSTGAQGFFQTAGKWLNLGLDEAEKFAVDAGLAGAESINCAIHR